MCYVIDVASVWAPFCRSERQSDPTLGGTTSIMDDPDQNSMPAMREMQAPQRTVLYVEDNPANMALVEQLIRRRADLKLLKAINGLAGVLIARECRPDVVVMDIKLSGIDGFAALKILREDPATAHIPVMALSSDAYPSQIEKGIEAGFFRYLTKPYKVEEFMDALDAALQYAMIARQGAQFPAY